MTETVDLTQNPRQAEFFYACMEAASGSSPLRQVMYGGGIRGGKTYAALATLTVLCAAFPGSKWVVYRKDFPALMDTTIPSMRKILEGSTSWVWHKNPSNFHVSNVHSGSSIYFYGENIAQDPDLDSILGLELNGVLLEQVEELSKTLYDKIQSRLGSWYIKGMPKPLMMLTTNPTQGWVKEHFYDRFRQGTLPETVAFIEALPSDNPFVTDEQRALWQNMDDRYRRQFIEGDWTDMRSTDDLFAWAFSRSKHVTEGLRPDPNKYLYLSFDFNHNPMSCMVWQSDGIGQLDVLEMIKLPNSNVYDLCEAIRTKYPGYMYLVTGDRNGNNNSAFTRDNVTGFQAIRQELRIGPAQLRVPGANPRLKDNSMLVNSVLQNGRVRIDGRNAKHLVYDLENVRTRPDKTLIKEDRDDPAQQADALDCFRYALNSFHGGFVRMQRT